MGKGPQGAIPKPKDRQTFILKACRSFLFLFFFVVSLRGLGSSESCLRPDLFCCVPLGMVQCSQLEAVSINQFPLWLTQGYQEEPPFFLPFS